MIVDSHCHLDDLAFDEDRDQVLERARQAGVDLLLTIGPGDGPPDLEPAIRLADRYDGVYATVGVHPHDAGKADAETFEQLKRLAEHHKVIAIGEIGLDYHYENSPRDTQRDVFTRQMELAHQLRKPIVIHTRDAWDETIELLETHWRGTGLGGIMHCFSGNGTQARRALDMGMLIAFGGMLTFSRAEELCDTASRAPLDRLLVETDAPYLTPAPFRKIRRNEPCYVVETARKLAELKHLTFEEVAEATTVNFRRLFHLQAPG